MSVLGYPKVTPKPSLSTVGVIRFWVMLRTNRETDKETVRQTKKQMAPTESVWVMKWPEWRNHRRNLRGTRGTCTPTFQDEKVKKIAVTCCQQRRSADYNKTVFPIGRPHDALPVPRVRWGGDTSSPFSSPFASGPNCFWIGTPLLDQSYAPGQTDFDLIIALCTVHVY